MSVTPPTSNTPPIAPPTPFAGGYRGSKNRKDGVGVVTGDDDNEDEGRTKANDDDEVQTYETHELSSTAPIPICPPPPKDTLLPTRTSSHLGDEDEDEEEDEADAVLAGDLNDDDADVSYGSSSTI